MPDVDFFSSRLPEPAVFRIFQLKLGRAMHPLLAAQGAKATPLAAVPVLGRPPARLSHAPSAQAGPEGGGGGEGAQREGGPSVFQGKRRRFALLLPPAPPARQLPPAFATRSASLDHSVCLPSQQQ